MSRTPKSAYPRSSDIDILRRRFSQAVWTTPLVSTIALPAHAMTSFTCPQFIEAANWYETTPAVSLTQMGQVRIVLVIVNDTIENFEVVDSFQLWTTPSGISPPTLPVTTNSITTGTVGPGETVTYDLTVDVSGLPASEVGFAFRGRDNNLFGNIRPNIASIVSSSGNVCG